LQLETISSATIRPLGYLTKHPEVDHHPPSQDAYGPLTPSLHLYLSRNALRTLPSEIFRLKYLTVLSLRNNKLTELSPAIGNLENLVELNVGINRLKWLPWEILKLVGGRLRTLNIYPNPLFEIPRSLESARAVTARVAIEDMAAPGVSGNAIHHQPWKPTRQAYTAVTFMNVDGSYSRGTPPAPSSAVDSSCLAVSQRGDHNRATLDGTPASRVPSLLELALRSCSQSPYLPQLPALLPADSPISMSRLLTDAYSIKEAGGRMCSVCGKSYLVVRTEWLEWWDWFPAYDDICGPLKWANVRTGVPLLRRGCSWQCIPADLNIYGF